jgi:hypothetical protein
MSILHASRGGVAASLFFLMGCVKIEATPENTVDACGDNIDNDQDHSTDCADFECHDFPSCNLSTLENCTGGADEDGDGQIDCQDPDCLDNDPNNSTNDSLCVASEICDDLEDNDGDGLIDCDDPSCNGNSSCGGEICDNGTDDDQDGLVDCDDANCNNSPNCAANPNCGNGQINAGEQCDGSNLNGQDCTDRGFVGGSLSCSSSCQFNTAGCFNTENCTNGADDDNDGFVDCADSQCSSLPNCSDTSEGSCSEPDIALAGSNNGDTTGKPNVLQGNFVCPANGKLTGPDYIFVFTPAVSNPSATITADPLTNVDIGILVYTNCNSESAVLGCIDGFGPGVTETGVGPLTAGVPVFYVVSGFKPTDAGPFTFTIVP